MNESVFKEIAKNRGGKSSRLEYNMSFSLSCAVDLTLDESHASSTQTDFLFYTVLILTCCVQFILP